VIILFSLVLFAKSSNFFMIFKKFSARKCQKNCVLIPKHPKIRSPIPISGFFSIVAHLPVQNVALAFAHAWPETGQTIQANAVAAAAATQRDSYRTHQPGFLATPHYRPVREIPSTQTVISISSQ